MKNCFKLKIFMTYYRDMFGMSIIFKYPRDSKHFLRQKGKGENFRELADSYFASDL